MNIVLYRKSSSGAQARVRKETCRERFTWNTWLRPLPYLFCRWRVEWTYKPDDLWSVSDDEPFWNYGGSFILRRNAEKMFSWLTLDQDARG